MSKESLQSLAERLVAYGRKGGASQIEVTVEEGRERNAFVFGGEVQNLTEAGARNVNMRVFVDGKAATASSSDLAEATLTRLVDGAIARARLGSADPFSGLPQAQPLGAKAEELAIHDPAIGEVATEKLIERARQLETIGLADTRVKKSLGATVGTREGSRTLVNSQGFSGSFRRSAIFCNVGFQAGEGQNLLQESWGDASRRLADLESPEVVARKAVERTVRLIGARPVPTQKVPMVLEPAMTAWVLGFLARCVGGDAIARRQSVFVDKLGQQVGNELVTIVDDGLLKGGIGTEPFDGEGVPCRTTTVVEKGILKSYLLDTYWGRKLKLPSTGNSNGVNNLFWKAGSSTPAEIVKSVDKGLLLTGVIGLGLMPTTGDMSVGAFGLWIEKGEIVHPVAEVTISGNLGEMLKGVQMVGNDLEMRDSVDGPTVKFAEITVGGKGAA
ncbi:MAG TPA: TldD/PmbA family protein [Thermoanaerobaculaceae bacterium]|nr:TldD/PmbA family protein [Thermoanaerobaculaceae bacterium]HPS78026.1 TldD/PmbA family protein [Thermoanaerobaculaceae bacterium]